MRGFQDKQKDYLQTDSPASTRPGFRTSCQMAATKSWDLVHIDLKTAFLQGQSCDVNRDVVCQLLPEAGHPPKIAERLKKPAYGMNDVTRRWWNILDKTLRSYGTVPTRDDQCCYMPYSIQSPEQAWEHWGQRTIAITKSREQSEVEAAFGKKNAGSHSWKSSYEGIINLSVDDLFGTGGNEMEQRVLTRLRQAVEPQSRTNNRSNDLPVAKKHKSMDSEEVDEEPQNEPGTTSTSQPFQTRTIQNLKMNQEPLLLLNLLYQCHL